MPKQKRRMARENEERDRELRTPRQRAEYIPEGHKGRHGLEFLLYLSPIILTIIHWFKSVVSGNGDD